MKKNVVKIYPMEWSVKYRATSPKHLGNSHERMQHLKYCLLGLKEHLQKNHMWGSKEESILDAVYDLELELSLQPPTNICQSSGKLK